MNEKRRILLTGGTGFVGQAVWPALEEAGYAVRGLTRDADAARARWPRKEWAEGDVESGDGIAGALDGCDACLYLVHGMGRGDDDFRRRDREAAEAFARSAAEAGVSRLLYLGGVAPQGPPSEHLASRLEVGKILRSGAVPCLELRASMIVGYGSLSWWIVRDLAARLPVMVIPRWMRHRTEPVAVSDVVVALVRGLSVPLESSASYDIPGPEALTEKEIVIQTARALGLRQPVMISVPVLSPWWSSHWVRMVTRADWGVAREIVLGLNEDLLARNADYWEMIGHRDRLTYRQAAREAVGAERGDKRRVTGLPAWVELGVRALRSSTAPA
jgi:uncharacterized protein YbjT (DUF2867 family)